MADIGDVDVDSLLAIALEAGACVMEVYCREFVTEIKADNSPLTEADTVAEALILERLRVAYPAIPIVAEEAAANGHVPRHGSRFFLVDPLDGSREFVSRNGEFTVNIALIENGSPSVGVVYAPALKRIWWGHQQAGAHVGMVENDGVKSPHEIQIRAAPESGLTVVGSRSHGSGEGDARLNDLNIINHVSLGSSLKFCLIAEGQADLYPRFGRTMEWDTAAGDAVLRAAGGLVVDGQGYPLHYGKREQAHESDFANSAFWAFGDGKLLDHILQVGAKEPAQ